jgi:hypothetical protein
MEQARAPAAPAEPSQPAGESEPSPPPIADLEAPPPPVADLSPSRVERRALAQSSVARAERNFAAAGDEIVLEGATSAAEGWVVLLVTARVDGPGTLELALDPAAASGYRQLASSTTPEQVSALYQIELRSERPAGTAIGVVRVRAEGANANAAPTSKTITSEDVATDWREARPELRDAALASPRPRD